MDNFFCNMRLLKFLGANNTRASGTLRQNRISKSCSIAWKQIMQRGKWGGTHQETAADNSTTLIAWGDNRVVYFASNCDPKSPEQNVKRYCRDAKQKVTVKQPLGIHKYNKSMGEVDRADQNVSAYNYRISIRSNRWWWPLFAWVPDMVVQNAWVLYRKNKAPNDPSYDSASVEKSRRLSLKSFLVTLPELLIAPTQYPETCLIKFATTKWVTFRNHAQPPKGVHWVKKNTRRWCSTCGRDLHDRCFNSFHGF